MTTIAEATAGHAANAEKEVVGDLRKLLANLKDLTNSSEVLVSRASDLQRAIYGTSNEAPDINRNRSSKEPEDKAPAVVVSTALQEIERELTDLRHDQLCLSVCLAVLEELP